VVFERTLSESDGVSVLATVSGSSVSVWSFGGVDTTGCSSGAGAAGSFC